MARMEDGVTEIVDGEVCAILGGELYKMVEREWVPVDFTAQEDRWMVAAYDNTPWCKEDGTYTAVGLHFNGNPYGLDADFLERDGRIRLRDFPGKSKGFGEYFRTHEIYGALIWSNGWPVKEIYRTDFGYEWPPRREDE